ncbi:hypothetical protein [Ferruginibacter sp.]|nr:hypothetical protein [Ferruginibacter sp.]
MLKMKTTFYKNIFWTLCAAVIIISVLHFGPRLSKLSFENYKEKINKNQITNRAIVTGTNTHKGKSVYFKYLYNGEVYKNNQGGDSLYERLSIGDSITIVMDSLSPEKSYVLF